MPFLFDRTWEAMPDQKSQFTYVGYPGLDSDWLEMLRGGRTRRAGRNGTRRCLFVVRRFLAKGHARASGDNEYVYDYEEFCRYVRLLTRAIERAPCPVEVVVKPHPSNSFPMVEEALHACGARGWKLSAESIFGLVADIDVVVSLYSTVFFVPAMAGVPTVVLHTSTQDHVNKWDKAGELYQGFQYYLREPDTLPEVLPGILSQISEGDARCGADVEHLRRFYPDGATARAVSLLGDDRGGGSQPSPAAA